MTSSCWASLSWASTKLSLLLRLASKMWKLKKKTTKKNKKETSETQTSWMHFSMAVKKPLLPKNPIPCRTLDSSTPPALGSGPPALVHDASLQLHAGGCWHLKATLLVLFRCFSSFLFYNLNKWPLGTLAGQSNEALWPSQLLKETRVERETDSCGFSCSAQTFLFFKYCRLGRWRGVQWLSLHQRQVGSHSWLLSLAVCQPGGWDGELTKQRQLSVLGI